MKTLSLVIALILSLTACKEKPSPSASLGWMMTPKTNLYAGLNLNLEFAVLGNSTPVSHMSFKAGNLPSSMKFTWNDDQQKGYLIGFIESAGQYEFEMTCSCFGTQVSGQRGSEKFTVTVTDDLKPLFEKEDYSSIIKLAREVADGASKEKRMEWAVHLATAQELTHRKNPKICGNERDQERERERDILLKITTEELKTKRLKEAREALFKVDQYHRNDEWKALKVKLELAEKLFAEQE